MTYATFTTPVPMPNTLLPLPAVPDSYLRVKVLHTFPHLKMIWVAVAIITAFPIDLARSSMTYATLTTPVPIPYYSITPP